METANNSEILEQAAQWIEERIPMIITDEYRQELGRKLAQWIEANNITIGKLAQMLAVSTSTASQIVGGKYKANYEKHAAKVVNLLNTHARKERAASGRPEFVDTTVASMIGSIITSTEGFSTDEGKIAMIIGDGGHGKSHCLRIFNKSNPNSVYVELDDCMTMRSILAEIAQRIGLSTDGSADLISRRIISALINRSIIVILDEASSLTAGMLNKLRQIICVKSRCPLILSGNQALLYTIDQPTTRRGYESIDQFTSRLMAILNLDALASEYGPDGGNGLYTEEDIRKLYTYGGLKLSSKAVDTLRRICGQPRSGRLRTCSHIITALHNYLSLELTNNLITDQTINMVIDKLGLPIKLDLRAAKTDFDQTEKAETKTIAATA